MYINNLVILGRACPEPLKNKRVTVCLAGWAEDLGFVRIYPTRPDMSWRRWSIVDVEVTKPDRDSRIESWKIQGSKSEWETLGSKIEIVGEVTDYSFKRNLVAGLVDEGIHVLNEQNRSLGIVKPEVLKTYFRDNPRYGELWQLGLPGLTELDSFQVKRDYPLEPRIRYTYPGCQTKSGYHDHQVLEWGFYEWFRNHPDAIDQVWENAGIGKEDTDIYFLVGNQLAHRNSFMIISVLRFKSGPVSPPLIPFRKIPPNTELE